MIHFYCYNIDKLILISDLPVEKVRSKYGYRYEILTSIADKNNVEIIKARLGKSYSNFQIIELYKRVFGPKSEETRRKMAEAKRGKPRPSESNLKTSRTMKGRSNFRGKKHSTETKDLLAEYMYGNSKSKNLLWVHNPSTEKETRVKSMLHIPKGYIKGRDFDSIEELLYYAKKPTNSPRRNQSS